MMPTNQQRGSAKEKKERKENTTNANKKLEHELPQALVSDRRIQQRTGWSD